MDKQLLQAVRDLIAEIENKQIYQDPFWFGPYKDAETEYGPLEDPAIIKWDELHYRLDSLKNLLSLVEESDH